MLNIAHITLFPVVKSIILVPGFITIHDNILLACDSHSKVILYVHDNIVLIHNSPVHHHPNDSMPV
ncbi:MAG: hypothetical protein WCP92_08435 [bacterium]